MPADDEWLASGKHSAEEVVPAEQTAIVSVPEILNESIKFIGISQPTQPPSDVAKGLNLYDLIFHITGSSERTENLIRLIWTIAILSALLGGSISGVIFFAYHYEIFGWIAIASAAIATISGFIAKARRYFIRQSIAASHDRKQAGLQVVSGTKLWLMVLPVIAAGAVAAGVATDWSANGVAAVVAIGLAYLAVPPMVVALIDWQARRSVSGETGDSNSQSDPNK